MTAEHRDYYNRRVGQDGRRPQLTLLEITRQVALIYRTIDSNGLLQRAFGYDCVDAGRVPGLVGADFSMEFLMRTGIRIDGGVETAIEQLDEVAFFTLVEFVYDYVAAPLPNEGRFHSYSNCGLHLDHRRDRFDQEAGRTEWRSRLNGLLKFYEGGYELSSAGEIVRLPPDGMTKLITTPVAVGVENSSVAKLANAVHTFQLGRSTREQRKQAIRDLLDILEYHRPSVVAHLGKDSEKDLFNIANNFALRHHKSTQKDDYDDSWLTWMFYSSLAAVHLVLGRVTGNEPFGDLPETSSARRSGTSDDDLPF